MTPQDVDRQKLEVLGQMTAAILHDLQSPIAYIDSNNRHLLKKINKQLAEHSAQDSIREVLEENETGLEQVKSLLESIKTFIKKDPKKKLCFLQDIIKTSLKITLPQARGKVEIDFQKQDIDDSIEAMPSQISQVLINLIINAIEAFQNEASKAKITIQLAHSEKDIILMVNDNAGGISADKIDSIFDWYVTHKATGTGQGLAICKQIIEEHSGSISCASTEGQGSQFTISLPRAQL